jgi:hypothetical protein
MNIFHNHPGPSEPLKSEDRPHNEIPQDMQPPSSDDGLIENLKFEDLDDTHYKITHDMRNNKPKPFFNKQIVVSSPESPSLSVFPQPLQQS